MASETLVSPLSLAEQTAALSAFLNAKRQPLSVEQTTGAVQALNLSSGGDKRTFARQLESELARLGAKLSYTSCLEAVAKMCGGENWMRLRQALLEPAGGSLSVPVYVMQVALTGHGDGRATPYASLGAAAGAIQQLLGGLWPKQSLPSLCSIEVRPQVLSVEFEHPTASWLTLRIFKTVDDDEEQLKPHPFSDEEVRGFASRMQRSLEFSHPGLLVMGAERSAILPATCQLLPRLRQPSTGFDYTCQTSMELYMWLGSFGLDYPKEPQPPYVLAAARGPVMFSPRWVDGVDGKESLEDVDANVAVRLAKRLDRLQRLTKCTMTEFISGVCIGPTESATAAHRLKQGRLASCMTAVGLSPAKVSELASCHINDVLRASKYGYATPALLQKLTEVLGLESPNELLPESKDSEIGMRVEDGSALLNALRDVHQFRMIVGDTIAGVELEDVQGIADSMREYVDLFQFSNDPRFPQPEFPDEPVDEGTIAGDIQSLINQLHRMNMAVLVAKSLRYVTTPGHAKDQPLLAQTTGTIWVERQSELHKSAAFRVHSA